MKQAIKILQKRIELLNTEYGKKEIEFENCEMLSDYEFLQSDLVNMELEITELQEAIMFLNEKVK